MVAVMLPFIRRGRRLRTTEVADTTTSLSERLVTWAIAVAGWAFPGLGGTVLGWWSTAQFALPLAVTIGVVAAVAIRVWWLNERRIGLSNVATAFAVPEGVSTLPLGPTPDATTYVDSKPPRSLEDRVAVLERAKDATDRTGAELTKLDGKIADVATDAKERINQACALFERHYDKLKAQQEAIWRAVQAREAELKLRSLNDEAAGLARRLLRANVGDYTTDGTPADFAAAWA